MKKPNTKPKWTKKQVQDMEDKWFSRLIEEREEELAAAVSHAQAWAELPTSKPIKKKKIERKS